MGISHVNITPADGLNNWLFIVDLCLSVFHLSQFEFILQEKQLVLYSFLFKS